MRSKLLVLFLLFTVSLVAQEYVYPFRFFTNSRMPDVYFYSIAEAGKGSVIQQSKGHLAVNKLDFHSPGNALEVSVNEAAGGSWKASVFHHGLRGQDHFEEAGFLSFWLKSRKESKPKSAICSVQLIRSDSSLSNPMPVVPKQGNNWQQQLFPLTSFKSFQSAKPEEIIGVQFSQIDRNQVDTLFFLLDDIEFIKDTTKFSLLEKPLLRSATGYAMHVDLQWERPADTHIRWTKIYRAVEGDEWNAVGIQAVWFDRFTDFTGQTGAKYSYKISFLDAMFNESEPSEGIKAQTRAMTDDELLTMVQKASFRYYWEGAEKISGLALENIPGRTQMIASGASGFGLMALIAGTERQFISRQESVERFVQIVDFLASVETYHGAFPHFIDAPSKKVEPFFGPQDNGADLVETAFLMQGLLAARQYFNGVDEKETHIRKTITHLWENVEWDWFRITDDSKFLYWHWSPDQDWVIHHPLIGWNETMVVYLLAIASPTHPVSPSIYYSGWASQDTIAQQYRVGWSQSEDGKYYSNGKSYYGHTLAVGVEGGGPLFFTHYSYLAYDPHALSDRYTNYFVNNRNIALINHAYCVENPKRFDGYGDDAWGLTASDGPFDYAADAPVTWQDNGKITPTGAIASFPYTPDESMKALKNYYYNYGSILWGEYGFRDAFSPAYHWCSDLYMGLNQAPMTVMIENYRTGLLWHLFMQNHEIQQGLRRTQAEGMKK